MPGVETQIKPNGLDVLDGGVVGVGLRRAVVAVGSWWQLVIRRGQVLRTGSARITQPSDRQ
jgi:hypothetical protein